MAQNKQKWFDEETKMTFEYFKYVAIFSISLVGLFGGFARIAYPVSDFPKDFIYGIYALGIVVLICFIALTLIVFHDFFGEFITIFGILICWIASAIGFFYGFFYLIKDFQEDFEIGSFILEFGSILVIGVIGFFGAIIAYFYIQSVLDS